MEYYPNKSLSTLKKIIDKYIKVECKWKGCYDIILNYLKCYRHYRKTKRINFLKSEIKNEDELNKKITLYTETPINIDDKVINTLNETLTENAELNTTLKEKTEDLVRSALKNSTNFSDYNREKYFKYSFHKYE